MPKARDQKSKAKGGIISLTTMVIISSIIIETGLISLAVSYLVGEQGFGVRMYYNATYAAKSAAQDAVLRVLRDKDVNLASTYDVQVGPYNAQVSGTRELVVGTPYARYTILSLGSALGKRVRVEGIVILDDQTGAISSVSYREIP
jgi:hypothetical protein